MSVIMAYYMVVLRSNAKFHWALVVFFVSGAWAQTLLPTSARKEFVYLGGRLVAVEAVTVVSPPPTVPAPVFWHKFDDGATNVATAEVGDNCSLSNHVWVQDPPSSGNYAVEFNGTTTIANCGSALDNLAPAFSVAAWIRPDNFGESSLGHIIAKVNASSNRSWFLHVSDSPGTTDGFRGIVVQANNTNQDHWEAAATLTPNGTTWYHLAWVVSNCSDLGTCTAQLYLNGSPVGIQVVNDTGSRPDDSTFQVSIGNRPAGDRTFDGLIDDVRVWNESLTGTQISAVYAEGRPSGVSVPAPIFWHKFNDGANNTATAQVGDNCSLSNHVWVQDPPSSGNYAVEFNGITTVANCGSALDNLAPALSMAAWIRPDNFGESSLGHIIAKVNASSNRSWFLHVSDSPGTTDGFRGIVVQANNTNQDHWEAAATLTPNGTTWYHLAWVVSNCSDLGTCTAQLYLNGSPVGIQVVNDTGARPDDSTFQVSIGNRPAGDRTFDGLIDDVRVWSQALSGAEISAVYAGGRE